MLPALTPLAIDVSRPFPQLANLSLNLAILLGPPPEGEDQPRLAVVQVPAGLRRLVRPPGGDGNTYVLLEEIIRAELATLFPGQDILEVAAFRVARDAELELDDEGGRAYLEAIEEELRKRRLSRVVRLEVEAGIGDTLLGILVQRLEIEVPDVYYVRGPLDMRALWPLVELPALEQLARARPQAAAPRRGGRRTSSPALGRGRRSSSTIPTSPSIRWSRSCRRRRPIRTCSPSSRRSTGRAATAPSCRPCPGPRRRASRSRCWWS